MSTDSSGSEIGRRLRQARHARGKSLAVIAGRAGISVSYLSRLESGDRALDSRALINALADALEIAPGDITGSTSQPGQLVEDRHVGPVRLALLAVSMGAPDGQVVPVEALTERATELLEAQRQCQYDAVGEKLPGLIRDLHTTVDAGRDVEQLLKLQSLVHVQGTQAWIGDVGGSLDLGWQAATLAKHAAEQLDDPLSRAISGFGTAFGLLSAGAFDLASDALHVPELGNDGPETMQANGMLTLTASLVAAAKRDHAERLAALEHAEDLARHTGNGNALWFGFGPANVGVWKMSVALEIGDHAEAARIATTINPQDLPSPTRKAAYYREFGRALARLPRRHDEAVLMLRQAETISPARVLKHPFMVSVLSELLARAKRNAVGRELRGMAHRAGLPV